MDASSLLLGCVGSNLEVGELVLLPFVFQPERNLDHLASKYAHGLGMWLIEQKSPFIASEARKPTII